MPAYHGPHAATLTDGDKGDITASAGVTVLTIDDDAVTFAKLQNITDARLLGRNAGTAGDAQEIVLGTNLSFTGTTLNAAGGGVSDGDKGDISVTVGGTVWTIDADVVTYAKMQNVSATDKLLGRSTAGAGDVEEIACTTAGRAILDDIDAAAQRTTLGAAASAHSHTLADITDEGALAALNTVNTAQIDNDAVTYAKMQNVSVTDRLLGRSTAGAGDVEEIILTAAGRALIDDATAADQRTTLGAAATAHTHSLAEITDEGALAALNTVGTGQIDNDAVTYAKIQNVTDARLLGRNAGVAGDVQEIVLGTNLSFTGTTLNATGGTGTFAVTRAIVTLPYASRSHSGITVTAAGCTASSNILLSLAGVAETVTNASDAVDMLAMQAVAGTGTFEFQANFATPIGGPLSINYSFA